MGSVTPSTTRKAAAIDIGTNSVKCAVGEIDNAGSIRILAEKVLIPRLGEGVHASHELNPDAQARTMDALHELLGLAHEFGAQHVRLVATSAVRDARNSGEFAERVKSELGAELEVLSEEDECRLSYAAAVADPELDVDAAERVVVDSGGGSTELTFGVGGRITYSKSIRLGAIRLTEQALKDDPPSARQVSEACSIARNAVKEAAGGLRASALISIGGSAVNLVRIVQKVSPDRTSEVHAAVLTPDKLSELIDMLSKLTVDQRKLLIGLDPERADTILAGAIIMDRVLAALRADRLIISTHGLRHALLHELLS